MTELPNTVAVTRNGRGDLWVFTSMSEATRHPLVQYGDAVLCGAGDVRKMYNRLDINELLSKLGDEELRVEMMSAITDSRGHRELSEVYDVFSPRVWRLMQLTAKTVPVDAGEVLNQIVFDRDHYNDGLKERPMTKTDSTENKAAETKAPKAPRYAGTSVIAMLADKDGKAYGPENNPKRAGSASADRFAHYGTGCTVDEFVAKGGTFADLDNDIKKSFISVTEAE